MRRIRLFAFFSCGCAAMTAIAIEACVADDPTSSSTPGADASSSDSQTGDAASSDGSTTTDGGAPTLVQISQGAETGCALYSDGSVWCWGDDSYGETGISPPTATPQLPQKVEGLPPATAISAGQLFSCAIAEGGGVWCWGQDNYDQLAHDAGMDNTVACPTACNPAPVQIDGIFARDVQAGYFSACALTTLNRVVCWGINDHGQLGAPLTTKMSATPLTVSIGGAPVTADAISMRFPGYVGCAIDSSHDLWCWGDNTYGELGHAPGTLGDVTDPVSGNPLMNPTPHLVTLLPDGGGGNFGNVTHVSAGLASCAIVGDASAFCWGDNEAAILATGSADLAAHPTPTQVLADAGAVIDMRLGNSSCALVQNGAVWCWGSSRAVDGTGSDSCTSYMSTALTNCSDSPAQVTGLNASSIDTSRFSSLAVSTSGSVVGWGNNPNGELGHAPGAQSDIDGGGGVWVNSVPTPIVGLP